MFLQEREDEFDFELVSPTEKSAADAAAKQAYALPVDVDTLGAIAGFSSDEEDEEELLSVRAEVDPAVVQAHERAMAALAVRGAVFTAAAAAVMSGGGGSGGVGTTRISSESSTVSTSSGSSASTVKMSDKV